MKVRKLAVALAVAGGLGSSVVHALGLGEVELQSYLNEPLDAEIALLKTQGVSPDNIIVELASEQSYKRLGLSRNFFLSNLKFKVTTAPSGQLVIDVSSREPVREPYLDFLIEVTWPSGRLMREYSVLVDPPVYAEKSGLNEQIQVPSSGGSVSASAPARSRTTMSAPNQTAASSSASTTSRTFGPTGASDTLWGIASQVRPNNRVSQQQTMLAIQDLNPDAFMDGNINRLKRGEVLRIPTLSQIEQRTRAQANNEVRAQNQAMKPASRPVDATARTAQSGSSAPAAAGGDELKLIAPGKNTAVSKSDGASAGGASGSSGGVDAGKAAALEELDKSRRANSELNARVDDLQSQVETLQRLIELKNSQLADMQNQAGKTEAATNGESATMAPSEADQSGVAGNGESAMAAGEPATGANVTEAEPVADNNATGDKGALGGDATTGSEAVSTDTVEETPTPDLAANDSQKESPAQPEAVAPTEETEAVPAKPDTAAATQPAEKPEPVTSVADKGFPATVIDLIMSNPLYQLALGGALVLLLLMLLALARRNANREKAFYDELNRESEDDSEGFDLDLEEAEGPDMDGEEDNDPLSEADAYIAYGRLDQAAQTLETAISREPSRTDLRLRLLAVYADSQDRESFEKQFRELETLQDDDASAEAEALRTRLEEAESMPSIDDLESQLRSDSFGTETSSALADDELAFGEAADKAHSPATADSGSEDEFDGAFDELNLDEVDADRASSDDEPLDLTADSDERTSRASLNETPEEVIEETDAADRPIEFDLSGLDDTSGSEDDLLELDETEVDTGLDEEDDFGIDFETTAKSDDNDEDLLSVEPEDKAEEPLDLDDEFASLDLDDAGIDNRDTGDKAEIGDGSEIGDTSDEELPSLDDDALTTTEDGALDESFLDELDAELEKVAGEDDAGDLSESDVDSLDDLELDVSDEDLALMEEVADSDAGSGAGEENPSLDEELGLEDTLATEADSDEVVSDDEDVPVVDSEATAPVVDRSHKGTAGMQDLDDSDIGEEDDFDFLSGTDEAATKLDLARAYIEMGDSDGARDILEEVSIEGSEEQKAEAQALIKNLS